MSAHSHLSKTTKDMSWFRGQTHTYTDAFPTTFNIMEAVWDYLDREQMQNKSQPISKEDI